MTDCLYRVVNRYDYIQIHKYHIRKKTPAGYKIWDGAWQKERFVLEATETSGKRFAYSTIEKAVEAFYYRKKRQIAILSSQLDMIKETISEVDTEEKRAIIADKFKTTNSFVVDGLYGMFEEY